MSKIWSWRIAKFPGPRSGLHVGREALCIIKCVRRSRCMKANADCHHFDLGISQSYQKCFVNCKVIYKCKQLLLWLFYFRKCLFFFLACKSDLSCRIGCMRKIRWAQKALALPHASCSKSFSKGHTCEVLLALKSTVKENERYASSWEWVSEAKPVWNKL